jgi:integrase
MQSSCRLDERARPEIVRNILGHVDIRMTQNVYGKSWWEERVDAVTQVIKPPNHGLTQQRET